MADNSINTQENYILTDEEISKLKDYNSSNVKEPSRFIRIINKTAYDSLIKKEKISSINNSSLLESFSGQIIECLIYFFNYYLH